MQAMRLTGWDVDGKHVHPLEAYRHTDDWLADFEAKFPDLAKRMHAHSIDQGWSTSRHRQAWVSVVVSWLNKRVTHNSQGPQA